MQMEKMICLGSVASHYTSLVFELLVFISYVVHAIGYTAAMLFTVLESVFLFGMVIHSSAFDILNDRIP